MSKENEGDKVKSPIIKGVIKGISGGPNVVRWEIPDGTYPNWEKIVLERSEVLCRGLRENNGNTEEKSSYVHRLVEEPVYRIPPEDNEIFPAGSQFEGENPFGIR